MQNIDVLKGSKYPREQEAHEAVREHSERLTVRVSRPARYAQ